MTCSPDDTDQRAPEIAWAHRTDSDARGLDSADVIPPGRDWGLVALRRRACFVLPMGGADMLEEGGWLINLLAALGFLLAAVGVVHATMPKRDTLMATCGVIVLVVVTGVGGTAFRRSTVNRVMPIVLAKQRDAVQEQGYRDARRPIEVAIPLVVMGLVLLAMGEIRRARRDNDAQPD